MNNIEIVLLVVCIAIAANIFTIRAGNRKSSRGGPSNSFLRRDGEPERRDRLKNGGAGPEKRSGFIVGVLVVVILFLLYAAVRR